MEKIEAGKYVELVYEILKVNGDEQTSVFKLDKNHPDAFVFGLDTQLLPAFQANIMGLEQGQEFDFILKPEDAFGERYPERICELDKNLFYRDGKFDAERIVEGAVVPMLTEDGMRIDGIVIKVTDDKVTMDFNDPWAGETMRFVGTVQLVRDATPEELQPKHHHGCSCGCEDCGGGDCGSDCDHDHDCNCGCS